MKHDELVSVIIPVYNVKPYISEAIESLLHQSYQNLEIIIVDDGSTDGSEDICDEYARKDKRIIVVHQDNKGLSAARNTGLDLMSGEEVVFLDADDALCSDYVSILMDTLIRESADVAMCKFTTHNTTEKMEMSRGKNATPEIEAGVYSRVDALRALCDEKINYSVWNKIYKRELWKDIRFPVGHIFEDVDVTFRIIDLCNKVCVVDQSLYMYRIRPGSITRNKSINGYRDWDNNHSRFEEFINANIPEVFSDLQLNRRCQDRLAAMITRYIHLSDKKENEWKEYNQELRRQIVEYGKSIGLRNCRREIKIKYWGISACPYLLKPSIRMFYSARRFIRKGIGKNFHT